MHKTFSYDFQLPEHILSFLYPLCMLNCCMTLLCRSFIVDGSVSVTAMLGMQEAKVFINRLFFQKLM